jgi:hypothetical protein
VSHIAGIIAGNPTPQAPQSEEALQAWLDSIIDGYDINALGSVFIVTEAYSLVKAP